MSTKNLYLMHFNNYFDRKIKKYSTLSEYQENTAYKIFSNINFIYGNGVETTQIFNIKNKEESDSQHFNYCIVVDKEDKIESRWFVLEQIRNSAGQYTISLKRDLISDFLDDIKKSKFFMEKSSMQPTYLYGTSLFNKEPLDMNLQPSEKVDIQESEFNWLTAFIPKTGTGSSGAISAYADVMPNIAGTLTEDEMNVLEVSSDGIAVTSTAEISVAPVTYNLTKTIFKNPYTVSICFDSGVWSSDVHQTDSLTVNGFLSSNNLYYDLDLSDNAVLHIGSESATDDSARNISEQIKNKSSTFGRLILSSFQDYTKYTKMNSIIFKYNNKIVKKPNDSKYYKLNIDYRKVSSVNKLSKTDANNIYKLINDGDWIGYCKNWTSNNIFYYYTVIFEEVSLIVDTINISAKRQHTIDCSYDIITFPYHKSYDFTFNGKTIINQNQMSFVNNFANPDNGDDYVTAYDIVITPYCPLNYLSFDGKKITSVGITEGIHYSTTTVGGLVFYCSNNTSDFVFNYDFGELRYGKVEYLSKKFELVSPDNSQSVPLPVYENYPYGYGDGKTYLKIKQTLLPYNSRLQVLPYYNGCYTGYYNGNSNRGLIYSLTRLTQMSNSWVTYVNDNSNYQKLFDAQISYSETQNNISNMQTYNNIKLTEANAAINAATGIINVGANVATGNVGGAISNTISTTTGTISNVLAIQNAYANQALTEKAQQSAINYTKDNYYLQTESMKNRSSTISTVGGIFNGYNYCPYILIYRSTICNTSNNYWDANTYMIMNYFEMHGFTYNVTCSIPIYDIDNKCSTYLQGFIYRFDDDIDADASLCAAINNELKVGIYV